LNGAVEHAVGDTRRMSWDRDSYVEVSGHGPSWQAQLSDVQLPQVSSQTPSQSSLEHGP
jgi:hypothetical protein